MSSLVLWSGGKDSTFAILELLKQGKSVEAIYVRIENNKHKSVAEQDAIDKMIPIIEGMYPGKFQYSRASSFDISMTESPIFSQPLIWLFAALYWCRKYHDELCIGYIIGDQMISFLDDLRSIWSSMASFKSDLPPLSFPLIKTEKSSIDSSLPPDILKLCVWCENPDEGKPCGYKCHDEAMRISGVSFSFSNIAREALRKDDSVHPQSVLVAESEKLIEYGDPEELSTDESLDNTLKPLDRTDQILMG